MYASDIRHQSDSLQDKLLRLFTLNRSKAVDLGFRPPFLALLEGLGSPHHNIPSAIHVAGTNGKGSVIACMRALLEAAGKTPHVYTSPHLLRFNERIVIAGRQIPDEPLEALIDEALAVNDSREVTFFEITTAMAFAAFAREAADYTLLEVGMGGRLDCTNVIEKSAICVITPVSYDHQEYLGDTLAAIAAEKAGIIKPGVPVVVAEQEPEAMAVIESRAAELKAPLYRQGREWQVSAQDDCLAVEWGDKRWQGALPALIGPHQIQNAGMAVVAALALGLEAGEQALRKARWPARMQSIALAGVSDDWEIYLDGGHNAAAASVIASQCGQWQKQDSKSLHVIIGMMQGKDSKAFIELIASHADSVTFVDMPHEPKACRAIDLQAVAALGETAQNWQEAVSQITKSEKPGRILITGSLYLAGDVLQSCEEEPAG